MIWQIVCRVGEEDVYEPSRIETGEKVYIGIDTPNNDENSIETNARKVLQGAGVYPPALALDLLHLGMIVYSADKRVLREAAYNRWERGFRVFLPVSDPLLWESVKPTVEKILKFLTSDHWDFEFRNAETDISIKSKQNKLPGLASHIDSVALLSGGLDSFVGAIDLLETNIGRVAFVSHHGRGNITHSVQDRVYSLLAGRYPKRFETFRFFVQPPKGKAENSSRSRCQ